MYMLYLLLSRDKRLELERLAEKLEQLSWNETDGNIDFTISKIERFVFTKSRCVNTKFIFDEIPGVVFWMNASVYHQYKIGDRVNITFETRNNHRWIIDIQNTCC